MAATKGTLEDTRAALIFHNRDSKNVANSKLIAAR